MTEDIQQKINDAKDRGLFEGQVLTQLADIKHTLEDMKTKHTAQDLLINEKVDKEEFSRLESRVWQLSGAAAGIGSIIAILVQRFL